MNIIYEDELLLVLDKPSGTPSAPLTSTDSPTAVGFALSHLPSLVGVGRKELEPGLLHRLDTGTSGLLVFAKTQAEFDRLLLVWKRREIKKIYRAVVSLHEPLPSLPYRIDFTLGHSQKSSKKMIAIKSDRDPRWRSIRGKPLPAITHVRQARPAPPKCHQSELKFADLEIQIETGVMHQIRCHLSSCGWPILGDSIYKGEPSYRLWLHAWRLEIPRKNATDLQLEAKTPW